jgi:hypothetical protein
MFVFIRAIFEPQNMRHYAIIDYFIVGILTYFIVGILTYFIDFKFGG